MPNRIRIGAIARDPEKDVVVGCRFKLSDDELNVLSGAADPIARSIVQSQIGQNFAAPDALLGFLASAQGRQMQDAATKEVKESLLKVATTKQCYLELTFSPDAGANATADPYEMQFVAYLERRLPPYKTSFTYFPADRALPTGEQPVQLGGPDAAQQLESYNSQPQLKFNRLKNTIFAATVLGDESSTSDALKSQFQSLFTGILKGRELVSFGVNEIGLLTVLIRDTDTGRIFDLDSMSSGEKGLILTFLLIARSVQNDGLILLDEPELHLNPAVCKDLLSYMIQQFVVPRNLQVLVCSHSPEILAGAFDSDDCSLYHLISSTTLSKVRSQDGITLSDALRRLGAVESENLLYRGIVFVEGPDDVALLEAGFGSILRRYKVKYSTGRKEIEKAILALQEAEQRGAAAAPTYFIFDRDEAPTRLSSSSVAKVLQWDRRCLENYLVDLDAIANLLMDEEIAQSPFTNQGDVSRVLRELAFQQLDEVAARKVYARNEFEGLGMRREDIANRTPAEAAAILVSRITRLSQKLSTLNAATWEQDFLSSVDKEKRELEAVWETKWIVDCDGKRLLEDLSKRVQLRISPKRFKVRLMKEIAQIGSGSWKTVESQLRNLLGTTTA